MTQQRKISRRQFVQATAASSLALAGAGLRRPAWAQSPKPNIVFILADDLGLRGCELLWPARLHNAKYRSSRA